MLQREKNKALKDWAVMEANVDGAKYVVDWLEDDAEVKRRARYNNSEYHDGLYYTLMKCVRAKKINWRVRNMAASLTARYINEKVCSLWYVNGWPIFD